MEAMFLTRLARRVRGGSGRGRSERGQTLVEYALIIAVVSLGAVAALTFLRDEIVGVFQDSGSALSEAGAAGGATPPPPPAPGIPTLGTGSVAIDCPGGGIDCDENEDATATRGGTWTDNGSAITGYYFEWFVRNDSCAGGSSWGTVQDRDPNTGTTTNTSEQHDLPDSDPPGPNNDWNDYSVRVEVHAVNGVGPSTDVATFCADVDG
jgi:Flp pilus assembly pilin Flp